VKARGHRGLATIAGHAATISAGEWITASGDWVNDGRKPNRGNPTCPAVEGLILTGAPGVGKTTIVNAILCILATKGVQPLLCAPTGRATKRLPEATGFEAKTVHRPLEFDPKGGGFKRSAEHPVECDLLAIDEKSMVDDLLMQALMWAVLTMLRC
jgi:hypothetical protein